MTGPQFEIVRLYVKQVGYNGIEVKNWDMLNVVGSPGYAAIHGNPIIPQWKEGMGLHNFQIEATVKNLTDSTKRVKFRTQTIPRRLGGGPGGIVESPIITIQPGATEQLPVWQLRMWSENIRENCWIVDENGTVYNCGVDYHDNNYGLHPTTGYRADNWYIPIDVEPFGPGTMYELRISFNRTPWADESAAQNILPNLTNTINAIVVPLGYEAQESALHWNENYYSFRYKKVGSPGLPLVPILAAIAVIAVVVGIIVTGAFWFVARMKELEIQEKAAASKQSLLDAATEAYTNGELSAEEYAALLEAISKAATIPDIPGSGWKYPTLEDLGPILILIIIAGAFALAYGMMS